MLFNPLSLAIFLIAAMYSVEASAEVVLKTLNHNPFNRPDVLRVKPQARQQSTAPAPAQQKIDFELTATLVSESTPMVVVDGKLLGIGDTIEGFELIAVTEGSAVFTRQGKKYSLTVAEDNDEPRSDY